MLFPVHKGYLLYEVIFGHVTLGNQEKPIVHVLWNEFKYFEKTNKSELLCVGNVTRGVCADDVTRRHAQIKQEVGAWWDRRLDVDDQLWSVQEEGIWCRRSGYWYYPPGCGFNHGFEIPRLCHDKECAWCVHIGQKPREISDMGKILQYSSLFIYIFMSLMYVIMISRVNFYSFINHDKLAITNIWRWKELE